MVYPERTPTLEPEPRFPVGLCSVRAPRPRQGKCVDSTDRMPGGTLSQFSCRPGVRGLTAPFDLQVGGGAGHEQRDGGGRWTRGHRRLATGLGSGRGPKLPLARCAGKGGSPSRPARLTWGTRCLLASNKQPTERPDVG